MLRKGRMTRRWDVGGRDAEQGGGPEGVVRLRRGLGYRR